jgi:predicted permease
MTLFAELRQAVRALQRAPSFSAISVMTLVLAIGGNTAIYSALRTLVLRPLPFADGDRLVYLWHQNPQMGGFPLTPPVRAIDEWRRAPVFEQIERYTGREVEVTGTGEPTRIPMSELEATTLPMLGIAPILGRSFVEGDFAPTAPPIVLIGHALWQSRFGGDTDVVGRTINLDDVPFVIVGVMPAEFRLPMGSDTLWTPAHKAPAPDSTRNALAKLRRGATVADAQAALNAVAGATNDPALKGWRGAVMSPRHYNGTGIETTLWTLAAAVGLLFVIGCVNVANLMLSRNSDRVREVALRQALGASRMQVVRYLLFECGVLAVVGGGFGLLLAQWLIAGMTWIKPRNLEALDRIAIDPHVIGFAALVSILTAVLFGLWPSLRGSALAVQQLVSPGSRTTPASGLRQRQILTAMQIGLALVLLVGAALLARSFARMTAVDPGFDPRGLIAMRLSLPPSRYGDPDPEIAAGRRQQFFDRVIEQVRAVPGVSAAAVGSGLPPELGVMLGTLEIEGRPLAETARGSALFSGGYVTPGFFTTLRIPIAEGRAFTESDVHGAEPVTIVGQAAAREYFRGASAIGARLRLDQNDGFARVVGIAGDVKAVDLDKDGDISLKELETAVQAKREEMRERWRQRREGSAD